MPKKKMPAGKRGSMFDKFKKFLNAMTETPRAAVELGGMHVGWPFIRARMPAGDGHPVLFFPGFLTADGYTSALRERVAEAGFKTYSWDGGFNLGLDADTAQHLAARLREVYAENGGQKVSLVGYSLGGIYARELAREFPDMVRSVITLGTPFGQMDNPAEATSAMLEKIYKLFTRDSVHENIADIGDRCLTPPPVPVTSIFSRHDGIARWQASLNPDGHEVENVEVYGSHLGMTVNPLTMAVVVDRLAQAGSGAWKPFVPHPDLAAGYPEQGAWPLPVNPRWRMDAHKGESLFGAKPAARKNAPPSP